MTPIRLKDIATFTTSKFSIFSSNNASTCVAVPQAPMRSFADGSLTGEALEVGRRSSLPPENHDYKPCL
eukprot:CAMPEP_0184280306 /NCGR_PEP_ID=MMETSP0977-20130417/58230_1 /TAXON_ID=483370 /ORGANISM="non described non described, Strain CCMP2097" /LENGTH=68 /DNA_ID=CAMNT_0026586273 /DNA_START=15 /DNA_END=219 /DNA_ORIENTATION=-